jgi:hypothetical protein
MPADTILWCMCCGRVQSADFAASLTAGWPSCCGRTMWLQSTTADLEAATRRAIEHGITRIGELELESEMERDRR